MADEGQPLLSQEVDQELSTSLSPVDEKSVILGDLIQAAADGHDEFAECIVENKDHITQALLVAMHTYIELNALPDEQEALRMSYFADEIGDVATDEYEWRVLLDELQILARKQALLFYTEEVT